jgi:hypothetical protein
MNASLVSVQIRGWMRSHIKQGVGILTPTSYARALELGLKYYTGAT